MAAICFHIVTQGSRLPPSSWFMSSESSPGNLEFGVQGALKECLENLGGGDRGRSGLPEPHSIGQNSGRWLLCDCDWA